jgi:4-amino-4-deoxy-L-arabinose transferase-like glycosyltransferase
LLILTLVVLFGSAITVRIYNLQESRLIAERQFRSAIIARAFYFESADSIPEWRKQVAASSKQRIGVLEPPITEILVSSFYRIVNGDHLWIARLLSSIFWIVGGFFLYRIAIRILSVDAAIFATTYYLFVPMGVVASISFLPDPLMIMMLLFSLLTQLRYFENSSKHRLVIAAVVSGFAILVKPFCVFTVLSIFILLTFQKETTLKRIINLDAAFFLGICFLIGASYYLYNIFIAKSLSSNFQAGFLPYLYFNPKFWKDWLLYAVGTVGFSPLICALIGFSILTKNLPRFLILGLSIGYVVFGLVYTYPIHISGHYHLQLIIIVALALGPLISLALKQIKKLDNKWYWWLPTFGALLVIVLFNIREVEQNLDSHHEFESEKIAQEIGEIVGHSTDTVYLAPYYGMPLEYYGELSGTYWPRRMVNMDWVKDRLGGITDDSKDSNSNTFIGWLMRRPEYRELSISISCRG